MVKGNKESIIKNITVLTDIDFEAFKEVLKNNEDLTDSIKWKIELFYTHIKESIEVVLNTYEEKEN